jgi:signal transduction histidine kinase
LLEAFIATLAAVGLTALGLGLTLEKILRRRVDTIAQTANAIIDGDLSQRVPLRGSGDEFDRLASVLNAMLVRISIQIATMRAVTDSLAHDLRLPLTRIRLGLEAALAAPDDGGRTAALERAADQTDDALRTFTTLIDIARADAGVGRDAFGWTESSTIIRDVAELFGPLAEDTGSRLDVEAVEARIWAQGALLRQVLGNLIHNAIKYAGEAGPILLASRITDGELVITVSDRGPGIAPEERERALRPFGRLERDGAIDGSGLGLALASACVRLHGGRLFLGDNEPGLKVYLFLPLSDGLPDQLPGTG